MACAVAALPSACDPRQQACAEPHIEPHALPEPGPVVAILLSGEKIVMQGVSCNTFVGRVRQRLAQERPLPPGNDYRLVCQGRVLSDDERLSASFVFAVVAGEDALEKRVRVLLDQVCPENLATVVDTLAEIEFGNVLELEKGIQIVIGKVLSNPHACETYAKMVYLFLVPQPETNSQDTKKAATFRRMLLGACQKEFEMLLASVELVAQETEGLALREIVFEKMRRKNQLLAIVTFLGHLFVGNVKFIALVASELAGRQSNGDGWVPEEYRAECMCELFRVVGHKVKQRRDGKVVIRMVMAWLLDYQAFFSRRVQCQIQALVAAHTKDL